MTQPKPPRRPVLSRRSLLLLSILLASTPLAAADPPPAQLDPFPTAIDADTLGAQRGRQGITQFQLGQVQSHINLSGNTVIGSQTGHNHLETGAFSQASGTFLVIQNTGNNVAIQESMVVNIAINP